jgi:hypothetical protein
MNKDNCYCWCVECGTRFTWGDIATHREPGCMKCGSESVPCGGESDVFVQVNWHELHILCYFAERWADHTKENEDSGTLKAVYAIAARLERQWPDMGDLTLWREIKSLRAHILENKLGTAVETNMNSPLPVLELGPGAVGFAKTPGDEAP